MIKDSEIIQSLNQEGYYSSAAFSDTVTLALFSLYDIRYRVSEISVLFSGSVSIIIIYICFCTKLLIRGQSQSGNDLLHLPDLRNFNAA